MPPEPLSWDRRDFRKHDRSAADPRFAGGGAPNRWREQPTAPPPFQQQRWFPDFRSPRVQFPAESHGRQSSWHAYNNDAGQGFVPSGPRYADRNLEDENNRQFEPRGDGRYNRENRNPFTRKHWKAPTWSPSVPAKPVADVSNLMSVQNTQQCSSKGNSSASPVPLNSVNLSEQSQALPLMKEKNNKNGGAVDESTGLESGKENCPESVDLKPLKSNQVGGLSSRDSCFSRSSTSKSVGVGPTNIVAELKPKNTTVVQSLADDACVRSNSPVLSEETVSGRKRRLGWGEGLAKYEKKRVEGPEDGMHKNELFVSLSNADTLPSESVGPPAKSPRVGGVSDCASPSTPSSVVCSSSPVIEEKGLVKEADMDLDTTNSSYSPSIAPKIHYDGPTLNLQNLELASIANLSLMIDDLLQTDDPTSAERTTSMSKLLVWKVDMLKVLEMTESEIESLETELKSLIAAPKNFCPVGSSSLPIEEQLKPCEEAVTASKCGIKFVPLQINSSGEMIAENAPRGPEDVHVLLKYEDIDSPGSATSRFVETAEVTEGSMNLNVDNSGNSEYVENHALTETTVQDLAGVSNMHCRVGNVYDSILSSNRDAARKCTEQLNKLLPKHLHFKSSITLQSDPSVVKTKFLMRKQSLLFKEKVLTIKFKAFRHFWKEGRLVSTRKLRGKTQKKFDPSRNGQKRHSSHARGPHTVPADEVIKLINGLLSKSAFKPHGSTLMMPALILDKEVKMSRFISTNGLVEDPCSVEKKRCMLNPWTSEEKEVFIDKLAAFGKDFGKIASFLDRRSVADCIEFYYKNHKSKCFEKIKKNPASSNQIKSPSKTYLVASGKRRNPELNASSLDILGAASEIVANIDNGIKLPSIFSSGASSSREAGDGLLQGSDNDKREVEAADVLASICGSLSSEGVSSCITSSVDKPGDGYQDNVVPRIESSTKQPSTPDVTQDVDDEMSDSSCGEIDPTDWSDEEKSIFVQAVLIYGKNFEMVSQRVGTRSADECKLFFSKARGRLELDQVQPGGGTPLVDNGGDSDIEDGCTVETGSVICNNNSDFSIEENLPPLDMKLNHQSDVAAPDFGISKGCNGSVPKDTSQTVVVSCHMESEKGFKEENDRCILDGLNEAENTALVEVSDQQPEGNSDNKIVEIKNANSGEVSDTSKAKSEAQPLTNVSWPCTSDSIAAAQILWGYPVSGQTMKERIGDVKCEKSISLPEVAEQNRKLSSDRFFLEKCNGKVFEAPFPSLGRTRDNSRPQPSCSSGEGPSRNGDVKLFGTILNSSQQKTNNAEQRTDGNKRRDHKISHESLNLNLGAHQTANLDSVQSKVGPKHIPVGYWDGNRIRTGVPPLPDSALLLAKYPTAFTSYTKLSQPPSVFLPHREASSSKGPADFRYPDLQPFTIGMNQRQDDVLHRRNSSFDLGSGMPNVNVVRRGGGSFAGGQGLSLSDPVRAMKMQYEAKIEELRLKGGNLIKEVDRWISGRR